MNIDIIFDIQTILLCIIHLRFLRINKWYAVHPKPFCLLFSFHCSITIYYMICIDRNRSSLHNEYQLYIYWHTNIIDITIVLTMIATCLGIVMHTPSLLLCDYIEIDCSCNNWVVRWHQYSYQNLFYNLHSDINSWHEAINWIVYRRL